MHVFISLSFVIVQPFPPFTCPHIFLTISLSNILSSFVSYADIVRVSDPQVGKGRNTAVCVYVYIGFKTFFYDVRNIDSIASYLPTGLHLGFFRS